MYSQQPEGQARRVPLPRSLVQPLPGIRGMLMAGLDGIQNKIDPGEPMDKDIYDLRPRSEERHQTPGLAEEALDALEADHEFLMQGGVFTQDLSRPGSSTRRNSEVDADPAAAAPVRVLPVLRRLGIFRAWWGSGSTEAGLRKRTGPSISCRVGSMTSEAQIPRHRDPVRIAGNHPTSRPDGGRSSNSPS